MNSRIVLLTVLLLGITIGSATMMVIGAGEGIDHDEDNPFEPLPPYQPPVEEPPIPPIPTEPLCEPTYEIGIQNDHQCYPPVEPLGPTTTNF